MKRQFSIYGALAAFTLFWGMLTGCEADDTPGGSSSGEVVPVTISLQMDEVDQLTKAVKMLLTRWMFISFKEIKRFI